MSARGINKIKIKKRMDACTKLFKYLSISKPIFFNFPDNQMDKIPLLKVVKEKIFTLIIILIFQIIYPVKLI